MLAEKNPAIKKALTIEEIFKKNETERRLYELREKSLRDEISILQGAKKEGRAEGRIETLQNNIIRYLQKKFKAGDLGDRVRQITDINILNGLYDRLLDAETPQKAVEIITKTLRCS